MVSLRAMLRLLLPHSSGDQLSKRDCYQELAHDQCVGVPQSTLDRGRLIRNSWFQRKQHNASESRRAMTRISLGSQNQVMKLIVDSRRTWIAEPSDLSQQHALCRQLASFKRDDVIRGTVNWPRLRPQYRVNSIGLDWGANNMYAITIRYYMYHNFLENQNYLSPKILIPLTAPYFEAVENKHKICLVWSLNVFAKNNRALLIGTFIQKYAYTVHLHADNYVLWKVCTQMLLLAQI